MNKDVRKWFNDGCLTVGVYHVDELTFKQAQQKPTPQDFNEINFESCVNPSCLHKNKTLQVSKSSYSSMYHTHSLDGDYIGLICSSCYEKLSLPNRKW